MSDGVGVGAAKVKVTLTTSGGASFAMAGKREETKGKAECVFDGRRGEKVLGWI